MQVMGFVVDLEGKCVEGLQMSWASYLINQLEQDFREDQDQGYEFHFSWLLILIAFIAWEMSEGGTFPDIETFEPLTTKFTMLWYSSDMGKQWQSNVVFHTYYLQLTRAIESFPRMMLNTLDRFRLVAKFHADRNFIYITARRDEHKEEVQSYYKLTEEDMEEITKVWPEEILVLVHHTELSDPNLIGSPVVTREEYDAPSSSRKKKKEYAQEIHNTSEETASDSPSGGGDDEVDKEKKEGEEDKQKKGVVTQPRNPLE
jgi:hypothetical protein